MAVLAGGQQDASAGSGVGFGVVMAERDLQMSAHMRQRGGIISPKASGRP